MQVILKLLATHNIYFIYVYYKEIENNIKMFDRIKRFFAENDIVLKFACCRKCLGKVVDEDIDMDIDINNDNKPDINITVEDGVVEVTTITDDGVKSNADGKDIGDAIKDVLENADEIVEEVIDEKVGGVVGEVLKDVTKAVVDGDDPKEILDELVEHATEIVKDKLADEIAETDTSDVVIHV